jgi:Ca-activated chloride channel homolog
MQTNRQPSQKPIDKPGLTEIYFIDAQPGNIFMAIHMKPKFFSLIALSLLIVSGVPAQSGRRLPSAGSPPGSQNPDDPVRLRADEVLLNVTVIDPYGRQATDLSKNDFIIAEDGKRQDIASFLISSVPVNVVLMLDASGSVAGEIASLRDAAMQFVEKLGPEDKVSVIEFHSNVELIQDWTSKAEEVRHSLSWRFKPGVVMTKDGHSQYGSTSLYDAIYATAEDQLAKVGGRKAIILLTDGDDTSSKVTYNQSLDALIRSGAVVYVVSKAQAFIEGAKSVTGGKLGRIFGGGMGVDSYVARLVRAEQLMRELSTRTGGGIYSPLRDEELKEVYGQVAHELKNQYILTYISKNEQRDGSLRQVKVFLTRSAYTARTRESYYAPKN